MRMVIAKRIHDRLPDGRVIRYRTKYYRHFDSVRGAVMGGKKAATKFAQGGGEMTQILSQLNQVAGRGFFAMAVTARPPRDLPQ